ncbi:hypothetical protein C6P42_001474 [Pichia californica]|nr:hypothetical protein C6P42_001474 [[Candida] californica]
MGRSQSQQERRLLDLLNAPVNRNKCGECKENDPTWASWNLGVFLCGRCASAHRSLGPDISVVKSLSMEMWTNHELQVLGKIGNKRNNNFWNEKKVPFPYDPDDKDSLSMWLREKYTGKFRYGSVSDSDYNLSDSWGDRTDDYGFDKSSNKSNTTKSRLSSALGLNYIGPNRRREQELSNKSFFENDEQGHGYGYSGNSSSRGSMSNRSYNSEPQLTRSMRRGGDRDNSRYNSYDEYDDDNDDHGSRSSRYNRHNSRYSSPNSANPSNYSSKQMRLSFRKPTNSEFRKYGDQNRKMKFDLGYEDEDVNVEALVLTRGNINRAIEIIKESGRKPNSANSANSGNSGNKAESSGTPLLPQRKETSGAIFDSSKAGGFNWLDDTTTAATEIVNSNSVTDNKIYQYVDPNTGAVYYIDANGQQYMDPNQQQQQQIDPYQLQQAQQQQLQQQALQQQQQMLTGFGQPTATGFGQPTATGFGQPSATGFGQPTATGFGQPTGIAGREPTLNELAQQQQQQQLLQQQQLMQQQQIIQQQQKNFNNLIILVDFKLQ